MTRSRLKPTTTAASATTTTTSAALKPKWKSLGKKAGKTNKLQTWKKNKVLNKQPANAQTRKNTLRQKSKAQSKTTTAVKPFKGKVKPKTNQTSTADFICNAPKKPNSLKDNTIHIRKIPPRKAAQKPIGHKKNSIKLKESAEQYHAFMNKTQTNPNVKTNTTMHN